MPSSMQIKPLAHAGWGATCRVNLRDLSSQELQKLGQIAATELLLVLRDQQLSVAEEVNACREIGMVEQLPDEIFHRCPKDAEGREFSIIQRVTGERDSKGQPTGLFYHNEELDWHVNRASSFESRKPLVWLRAIKGVEGSRTSWINCQMAFEDLPDTKKMELRSLKGYFGYGSGKYSPVTDFKNHINESPFPIVYRHPLSGKEALYFPFHQLFGIEGMGEDEFTDFSDEIKKHLLNEKYIYHHDWKDGDIVLSEQWCTLHKRWRFDVSNRLLHRVTMDYQGYRQPSL